MDISKNGKKLNMSKDRIVKILKSIFIEGPIISSVYELAIKSGIPQPTVKRYIPELENDGYIKTTHSKEGRKSISTELTNKALLYLVFYGDLSEKEISMAFGKLYDLAGGSDNKYSAGLKAYKRALTRIKPRINLDYYDSKYANELLFEMTTEASLEELENVSEKASPKEISNIAREGLKIVLYNWGILEKKYEAKYRNMKSVTKKLRRVIKSRG